MIDLTPLDVRKKKGDFRRAMRGYEAAQVDEFLELAAERMEELVRENAALKERAAQLSESVASYREREKAMNEALVSAQELREELRNQANRDAEHLLRDARSEAERLMADARRDASAAVEAARRVHVQRGRYLKAYRAFVEKQLGEIEMEEARLREALSGDSHSEGAAARPSTGGEQTAAGGGS